MHPSQVQLRIANLWKGAFKSELLLQVGVEIINFIAAAVHEAAIKKKTMLSSRSHKTFLFCSPFKTGRFIFHEVTNNSRCVCNVNLSLDYTLSPTNILNWDSRKEICCSYLSNAAL